MIIALYPDPMKPRRHAKKKSAIRGWEALVYWFGSEHQTPTVKREYLTSSNNTWKFLF